MAVYGTIGNIGSGKTLFITALGYMEWKRGMNIYANYNLSFDFTPVNLNKEIEVKENKNNLFLLDEIWLSMDSRKSQSNGNALFTKAILQSRKWGGKLVENNIFYTTQSFTQVDKRTRRITSVLFAPNTIFDKEGKPYCLEVYYNGWVSDIPYFPPDQVFYQPLWDGNIYIPDLYDTSEILESMDDGGGELRQRLIEKYMGWDGKKGELKSVLIFDEDVEKSVAGYVADYVIYKGNNP